MVPDDSTHLFGITSIGLRGAGCGRLRRTVAAIAPLVLAVSLLGHGIADGQTPVTATSAQGYATAINSANAVAPSTQIVINSPSGAVISLGAISLPTLASGSTLQIGNGSVDSPIAGGTITDNATLSFDPPNAANDTISTIITGTGTVTQRGLGTITFTGSNTYSGGTTITSGTLAVGGSTVGTLGTGPITNNAALVFNEPSAVTIANAISGNGTLTQKGPGTVTLTDNGNNSYSGGTTIASGSTLTLGDGTTFVGTLGSGAVTNNGALVFNEPNPVTLGNNISGTGTVMQQDLPGVTLSGTNTYSGTTTIIGNNNVGTSFVFGYYNQQHDYGVVQLANEGALSPNTMVTIQRAGGLAAGYALDQTTLNAISSASVGFVALGADSANDLDFTNLPQVSLGAEGLNIDRTYTGTLTPTPPGGTSLSLTNYQYQVGGGNGFLVLNTDLADPSTGTAELDAVNNGFTILQGFNTFTGGMNVSLGVVELTDPNNYCSLNADCQGQQTAPPIQIAQTGVLATSYALDQATLNAIAASSNGTVALGANSSNDLDFTNLPTVSLGAVGSYTYSGTITPEATAICSVAAEIFASTPISP